SDAAEEAAALTSLRREKTENAAVMGELQRKVANSPAARGNARSHIRHGAEPVPASAMRFNQAAELWAAISVSLLLGHLAILLVPAPENGWAEAIVLVLALVVGEAVLRGTYTRTINRIGVILALVAVGVLVVQFAEWVAVGLLAALALF